MNEWNSIYGSVIGFTVAAMVFVFGEISGGVFNPAVAIGISLASMSAWANISIFFVPA